jgi:hypothetical protein
MSGTPDMGSIAGESQVSPHSPNPPTNLVVSAEAKRSGEIPVFRLGTPYSEAKAFKYKYSNSTPA